MARRKRDSPEAELRRELLERLRDAETRSSIADALIRAATGEGKGAGDVIKGYDKITEILHSGAGAEDGAALSDAELVRRSTPELLAMLERL